MHWISNLFSSCLRLFSLSSLLSRRQLPREKIGTTINNYKLLTIRAAENVIRILLPEKEDKVKKSLVFLKNKAKTLEDIFNNSKYLLSDKVNFNDEDLKLIDCTSKGIIAEFKSRIKDISKFDRESLEPLVNELIKTNNTNFKGVGQPLRIALTGSKYGPGIYDIIVSLGKDEVLKRLGNKIFI